MGVHKYHQKLLERCKTKVKRMKGVHLVFVTWALVVCLICTPEAQELQALGLECKYQADLKCPCYPIFENLPSTHK